MLVELITVYMEGIYVKKNEELFIVLLTHLYCMAYTHFLQSIKNNLHVVIASFILINRRFPEIVQQDIIKLFLWKECTSGSFHGVYTAVVMDHDAKLRRC